MLMNKLFHIKILVTPMSNEMTYGFSHAHNEREALSSRIEQLENIGYKEEFEDHGD